MDDGYTEHSGCPGMHVFIYSSVYVCMYTYRHSIVCMYVYFCIFMNVFSIQ